MTVNREFVKNHHPIRACARAAMQSYFQFTAPFNEVLMMPAATAWRIRSPARSPERYSAVIARLPQPPYHRRKLRGPVDRVDFHPGKATPSLPVFISHFSFFKTLSVAGFEKRTKPARTRFKWGLLGGRWLIKVRKLHSRAREPSTR